MKTKSLFLIPILLLSVSINGQSLKSDSETFTRQDSLRGSITPERVWWDLNYYHLDIKQLLYYFYTFFFHVYNYLFILISSFNLTKFSF